MEEASDKIVSVSEATIYQDDMAVLRDISFHIDKGEFVYLIGKTGSGKSSLLKTLYADLPFKHGQITVAGHDLHTIKRSRIPYLRRKIGVIFQDFQLLYDRTVADNMLFVMRATGWKDTSKMKQRLSDVLIRVGLASLATKMPHQLSGGEQQRIVVARALINEPMILFADEPTGNLDPEIGEEMMMLFKEINKSGTAILMATHNHNFLDKFPSRVLKVDEESILDSEKQVFSFRQRPV
ncbi:MAG TPA: ATP-binding cassette domain-containing protein [Cytophagaceae bacterium]|jgi:cell division transport system ATP-binding protein